MIKLEENPHTAISLINYRREDFGYALEDDIKHQFLSLAVDYSSLICYRVSAKQKAMVARLVGNYFGDGVNDVSKTTSPFLSFGSWRNFLLRDQLRREAK
ncbi:hypothetical protein C5167_049616, partial [Papaver somniferum]